MDRKKKRMNRKKKQGIGILALILTLSMAQGSVLADMTDLQKETPIYEESENTILKDEQERPEAPDEQEQQEVQDKQEQQDEQVSQEEEEQEVQIEPESPETIPTKVFRDQTPPEIEITAEAGLDTWYTSEIELEVKVVDRLPEEQEEQVPETSASGETVIYEEYVSGIHSVQIYLDGELLPDETEEEPVSDISENDPPAKEVKAEYNRSITIRKDQVDGTASLVIRAVDHEGNENRQERILFLDGNAPIMIGTGLEENGMYGEQFEGELIILERNPAMESFHADLSHTRLSGEEVEDAIEDVVVDEEKGTITIPLTLSQEGVYDLAVSIADKASNKGEIKEHFSLDLEPPVVVGLQELDGQYFDKFEIPWTVEEMVQDMSQVTARFWLDGMPYSLEEEVTSPGLHVLKGEFRDAFAHETTEVVRFVVRAGSSILQRSDERRMRGFGVASGKIMEVKNSTEEISGEERDSLKVEEADRVSRIREEVEEQNRRIREILEQNGSRIFRWILPVFVGSALVILLLSLYEKRD